MRRANLESGRSLVHLASRIFNSPLAIWQKKGDVILHLLGPRLGISELPSVDASLLTVEPRADRFGASGGNRDAPYAVTKDGIAVCDISGTLVRRATGLDALSGLASYETIEAELVGALQDANVKGILMCCDSPGGEVGGLFDLVDKLVSLKGSKPMHAAVSEMACSAMYAIASVCDQITVTQTAAAGSIGVYALHVDQSGLNKEMGLKYTYIFAGAHKVDGNPNEPLTDEIKSEFQSEIDRTYGMFVDVVSKNRKMSAQKVRDTEARVYYGADGIAAGLVDAVGTPDQAMAGLRAKIDKRMGRPTKSATVTVLTPVASVPDSIAGSIVHRANTELDRVAALPAPIEEIAGAICTECGGKGKDEDGATCLDCFGGRVIAGRIPSEKVAFVNDLCKLAGFPKMAPQFLADGLSKKAIHGALIDLRAQLSDAVHINSYVDINASHSNRGNFAALESQASELARRDPSISKEKALWKALEANPSAYADYLRSKRDDFATGGV